MLTLLLDSNGVCSYQLLVDLQSIVGINTVIQLVLVEVGQRLDVPVHPPIHVCHHFVMICLRVGSHEEFEREEIAVLLVEFRHHSLLRVETRIFLLVGDLLFEFLLGWVVDLSEPCIPKE